MVHANSSQQSPRGAVDLSDAAILLDLMRSDVQSASWCGAKRATQEFVNNKADREADGQANNKQTK